MRDFSMRRKSRVPGWLKGIMILAIAWSLVGAGMYYRAGAALKACTGIPGAAFTKIRHARYVGFFPLKKRLDEMENVADILAGRQAGYPDSARLAYDTYRTILRNLLAAHRLDTFSALMNYLNRRGVSLPRFRALLDFDQGNFSAAAPVLKGDPAFAAFYKSGFLPVIRGVLDLDMKTGKYQAKLPGTAFLETAFRRKRHFLFLYESSLDPEIQRILYQSMGKWDGAFLLTKKFRLIGVCGKNMNPFRDVFEAGSVIKLVTMAAALSEGVHVSFPYHCDGPIRVGGRIFYDWKKHGKLNSMADSLACSCNLVFAETALKLGPETESRWLERFGINHQPVQVGELQVLLGEQRLPLTGDYALARAAIGLDTPFITPYWLVRTAASLANGGQGGLPTPFVAEVVPGTRGKALVPRFEPASLFPKQTVSPIEAGMLRAVTWKNGTGKRAAIPGMKLMLKTGTAGISPYNSVLTGIFEVDGDPYAFGLFLKKAGRAEFNGTAVLKSALEKLRLRLMSLQRSETEKANNQ